jgi:hypothetical protein
MARYDGTRWGVSMVNPGQCRSNADSCIEMANARAWLEIAGHLEREDAEHEELLRALARHFRPVRVFPTH